MLSSLLASYWHYLLVLLACLLAWWLGRRSAKKKSSSESLLNSEYVKGFNYLLNDQSDKAVEVFVKALEVDSETVELHLALGGLFRKEGQVGRATRIHQNIIARPYLTDEQNTQAVFELAQDYFKAGLFDRAESLFLELLERKHLVENALLSLAKIYESEKEWSKAINITQQLDPKTQTDIEQRLSHYWCELAKNAIEADDFVEAKRCLQESKTNMPTSLRRMILESDMEFSMNNVERAIYGWKKVIAESDLCSDFMVEKIYSALLKSDDAQAIEVFLSEQLQRGFSIKVAQLYLEYFDYSKEAYRQIYASFKRAPTRLALAWLLENRHIYENIKSDLKGIELLSMFDKGLGQSVVPQNLYQCKTCGFESKVVNWQCPSCKNWDKQALIH